MEELNEELKELFDYCNIQVLPSKPKYWLIRTESGSFYDIFKKKGYVSIGFDKLDINDITKKVDKENDAILKNKIASLYPEYKKPGLVLSQLRKFLYNIQKGDIIVIPSKNSNKLCVGQAISDPYQVEKEVKSKEVLTHTLTYNKRIDVKWIAEISKSNFDIYVFKLLNSHQCIVNIDDYKSIINRMIFPFYYQDGAVHVSLYVSTDKPIPLSFTNNLLSLPEKLTKLYEKYSGDSIDKDNIALKSTINSPGSIEIFGSILAMVIFGAFVFGFGGKFTRKTSKISADGSKKETETSFESEGFVSKLFGFLHQKSNDDLERLKTESDIAFKALEIESEKNNTYLLDTDENLLEKVEISEANEDIDTEDSEEEKDEPVQQSFFDD